MHCQLARVVFVSRVCFLCKGMHYAHSVTPPTPPATHPPTLSSSPGRSNIGPATTQVSPPTRSPPPFAKISVPTCTILQAQPIPASGPLLPGPDRYFPNGHFPIVAVSTHPEPHLGAGPRNRLGQPGAGPKDRGRSAGPAARAPGPFAKAFATRFRVAPQAKNFGGTVSQLRDRLLLAYRSP